MYDSITLWLENNDIKHIPGLLEKAKELLKKDTGEWLFFGNMKNLKIKVLANSISINGSLAKYKFGNNLQMMTIRDIKEVIEDLGDNLRLPIAQAKVFRLEFGANIELRKPVSYYLSALGGLLRYRKDIYGDYETVNYITSRRSLKFYNKIKEMICHHENLTLDYQNKNVLRYELKFLKRIKEQFKMNENLKANQLYDEKLFQYLINRWQEEYFKIERMNKLRLKSPNQVTDLRELKNQLSAIGIRENLEINEIIEMLKQAQEAKEINSVQFNRMKNGIFKLCSNPSYIEPNDCILELDEKVRGFTDYASKNN